jgi:hypothetical protein
MGRTLPPFSQLIEQERRAWAPFRRALRKDDQVIFDRLFDCAKLHVQAGVYLSRPWPFEVIAMAILLEHYKLIEQLLTRLQEIGMGHPPPTLPDPTVCHDAPALKRSNARPSLSARPGESHHAQGNMFESL